MQDRDEENCRSDILEEARAMGSSAQVEGLILARSMDILSLKQLEIQISSPLNPAPQYNGALVTQLLLQSL